MSIADPDNPLRQGVSSPLMYPYAAILDPQVSRSLPPRLTAATGMEAIVHALEAYMGRRANLFTDQLALAALHTAWTFLPRAVSNGRDTSARQAMMLAALWGGAVMDQAGQGLVNALSTLVTSHLHVHHGLANAVILPHALRYVLPTVPEGRRQRLNRVFGLRPDADAETLVKRLEGFVRHLELPTHLRELETIDGVDWEAVAEEAAHMAPMANSPREISTADCQALLSAMQG